MDKLDPWKVVQVPIGAGHQKAGGHYGWSVGFVTVCMDIACAIRAIGIIMALK
jgi:hypothetical protein